MRISVLPLSDSGRRHFAHHGAPVARHGAFCAMTEPFEPTDRHEQRLLGAILSDPKLLDHVADVLVPEHFVCSAHARAYAAILELSRSGRVASPFSVRPFFGEGEEIAGMSAAKYLIGLVGDPAPAAMLPDTARTIRDMAIRRSLAAVAADAAHRARTAPVTDDAARQVEDLERDLFALVERGGVSTGWRSFGELAEEAVKRADRVFGQGGALCGLSTGLADLDERLGGLQDGDLLIVAGRPGMGKSALATNIAVNCALRGEPVAFFSLEMSGEQLATRVLADRAAVSSSRVRRGGVDREELGRFADAARSMSTLPLWIDATGGLDVGSVVSRARRHKRRHGMALLVVDYLQLLSGTKRAGDARVQEVTEITTTLKALAKELNVPVLALSQLSRQVENRDDKRPILSDLRESGSIEQDADVVMFVYREEYYLRNGKPEERSSKFWRWQIRAQNALGIAEVIVAKHRHGPTGTCRLHFDAEATRFSDLARGGD